MRVSITATTLYLAMGAALAQQDATFLRGLQDPKAVTPATPPPAAPAAAGAPPAPAAAAPAAPAADPAADPAAAPAAAPATPKQQPPKTPPKAGAAPAPAAQPAAAGGAAAAPAAAEPAAPAPRVQEVTTCKDKFTNGDVPAAPIDFEAVKAQEWFRYEIASLSPCLMIDGACDHSYDVITHLAGAVGSVTQLEQQKFDADKVPGFIDAVKNSGDLAKTISDHAPCITEQAGGVDAFLETFAGDLALWYSKKNATV